MFLLPTQTSSSSWSVRQTSDRDCHQVVRSCALRQDTGWVLDARDERLSKTRAEAGQPGEVRGRDFNTVNIISCYVKQEHKPPGLISTKWLRPPKA